MTAQTMKTSNKNVRRLLGGFSVGSFWGHVVPGTFFIAFALWWAYSIFKRYFASIIRPNNQPYQSTAAFISKTSNIPAEPLLKLIASVIGIVGEARPGPGAVPAAGDGLPQPHQGPAPQHGRGKAPKTKKVRI